MKVGDLVYVAKPSACCGADKWLGLTFIVDVLMNAENQCNSCGYICTCEGALSADSIHAHLSVLRVIPPLKELESQTEQNTVNA